MIYGVILAGGIGSRMGDADKPKQFLNIGKKPLIVRTVEKFVTNEFLDKVIVLCPREWVEYTENLLREHLPDSEVSVVEGGSSRNETIINAIQYIEKKYGLSEEDILVTHDAVRPFVTQRMIEENIEIAKQGVPCNTVIPAVDTILISENGEIVTDIPKRANCYQVQTPQTFGAKKYKDLHESLPAEERESQTDAIGIFVRKGIPVKLVRGETFNIKITYPYDIRIAEAFLNE